MKIQRLLRLYAIALSTLVIAATPALAHDLYGETGEYWSSGAAFEEQGDFSSAINEYQAALNAIESLNDHHLRECAAVGTVSRLAGAIAGQQYVENAGSSATLEAAREVSQDQFRATVDEIDATRPDLANSCP